ncbi:MULTISPECIES: MFS transporter [unclassified Streptomyces]|uniref:MFS transporter n=1 Tax=unclassified Streptomyces TaxID=2593676 RepID=UPI0022B703FD|nr:MULTISPECIES: MFS transporter [unclassified Streptomyces]MCZ7416240.1 MFS transporter [Streptomyces sp. WMMC897]MCZ7433950.1 MFS transporter [Streptomyces sp. WMMC1477]
MKRKVLTASERDVLRNRPFRRLLLARTSVLFGNGMGPVGLAFAVLALPGGDGRELSFLLFARAVAQIAMLLFGGVLADRYSKVGVMLVSDATAGAAHAGMAFLFLTERNPEAVLIALAALSGAANGAFLPASTGVLPELVRSEGVQSANALLRVSQNAASIGGASLVGGLIVWIGAGGAVAVNGVMYLLSAFALIGIPRRGRKTAAVGASMLRELVEGWQAVRSRTWVWVIVAQCAIVNALFHGAIRVLGPVVAEETPSGPSQWAFALAAQSAGLLVGGAFALRLNPRWPLRTAAYCIGGFAPPLLLLGLGSPLWTVAVALFCAGVCIDVFTVLWETALQRRVPPEQLSRVSSYDALGSFALIPLGTIVAAPIAGTEAQEPALVTGALLIVLLTVWVLLVPGVRRLPRLPEPVDEAGRDGGTERRDGPDERRGDPVAEETGA